MSKGQYKASEETNRILLELYKSYLGEERPSTITIMSEVGTALTEQRKYTDAETIYREVLPLFAKVSRQEHLHTLVVRSNLAKTLDD